LPANTVIVNINGAQDGARGYNGDQSLWYTPFSESPTSLPPACTVTPGVYSFRVIDPADAAAMFPDLTAADTNQIFTAWTYNSPWILDYMAFDAAAITNHNLPQIFDGAPDPASSGNPADAYNHGVSNGYANLLRVGPAGRDSTNFAISYTFTTNETLVFIIPDYDVDDNHGGVSVVVSKIGELNQSAPPLSISASGGNVTLQWPTNFACFIAAQSPALTPSDWTDVAAVPSVVKTNYSLTLPIGAASAFFRLHFP
jgi:hypothetical protein